MDLDKIFSLMDKAEKSSFSKIEIQMQEMRISLERQAVFAAASAPVPAAGPAVTEAGAPEEGEAQAADDDDLVTAPISGVFYVAKEPGAAPFVREGQQVRQGDTVCIIEAMKMMNEIAAPKNGVIERVLAADAQAISAGDALFVYAKEN